MTTTRGSQLRRLADAALAISRESDVDEILRLLAEAARAVTGARDVVASRDLALALAPSTADAMVAPLLTREGGELGVVRLLGKRDGGEFTDEDEAMLV